MHRVLYVTGKPTIVCVPLIYKSVACTHNLLSLALLWEWDADDTPFISWWCVMKQVSVLFTASVDI